MKKITTLVAVLVSMTSAFAHDLLVPHAHDGYMHGFENFLVYLATPLVLIAGIVKLISVIRRSNKA